MYVYRLQVMRSGDNTTTLGRCVFCVPLLTPLCLLPNASMLPFVCAVRALLPGAGCCGRDGKNFPFNLIKNL